MSSFEDVFNAVNHGNITPDRKFPRVSIIYRPFSLGVALHDTSLMELGVASSSSGGGAKSSGRAGGEFLEDAIISLFWRMVYGDRRIACRQPTWKRSSTGN